MSASETSGAPPEAVALAGRRAGKSLRAIAVELYGREEVGACWHDDSPMRSRVRRLLSRAGTMTGAAPDAGLAAGFRKMAASSSGTPSACACRSRCGA